MGSKLVSGSMSISPASRSNVQYNPAGDTKNKIKTSSLEIGFLGTYKLADKALDSIRIPTEYLL